MVFVGIILHGSKPLHVSDRCTVIDVRYTHTILEPYVHLFMRAVNPNIISMHDNALPHRTSSRYLSEN